MKLRNKKTGESIDIDKFPKNLKEVLQICAIYFWRDYEICEPAEPLIKDPKIRKAVRAWAEANGDTRVYYHRSTNEMCVNDDKGYVIRSIKFKFEFRESIGLESGWYAITELCGSEE